MGHGDYGLFRDRLDAGRKLAERLIGLAGEDSIVLAVPRGGVPIGSAIAQRLACPLDLIIPRKLPIPANPEAGFGAVMGDGTIVLNEPLVRGLKLTKGEIDAIVAEVSAEVRRREQEYRGRTPPPLLSGKQVILVDDGLASGYTMIAAAQSVRRQSPRKVIVAVPVSPVSSIQRVRPFVDDLVCLIAKQTWSFAVASFYRDFADLTDDEVRAYIAHHQKRRDVRP